MDKKLYDIKAKMDALGIVPRAKIELAKIQAIEAEHKICFPKDYVAFITQIGDGWERHIINGHIWMPMNSFAEELDTDYIEKPFPYTETWIWEDNDTNPLPNETDEEWDERVDRLLEPVEYGNIQLINVGDGGSFNLIVTGSEKGNIWFFSDIGIAPCVPKMEFLPWLDAWLSGEGDQSFYDLCPL